MKGIFSTLSGTTIILRPNTTYALVAGSDGTGTRIKFAPTTSESDNEDTQDPVGQLAMKRDSRTESFEFLPAFLSGLPGLSSDSRGRRRNRSLHH